MPYLLDIRYLVDSIPGADSTYPLVIDFHVADATGQGEIWLASDLYGAADAGTFVDVIVVPAGVVAAGNVLVATATDSSPVVGASSEFSAPITVPEPSAAVSLVVGVCLLFALERFGSRGSAGRWRRCMNPGQVRRFVFAPDSPKSTESSNSTCSAIQSAGAETFRPHSGTVRENSAIPRGLGRQALAYPNRRRLVRGQEDAAGRVFLCCQVERFGFALDSP
jgi:hypothetical protein